MKDYWINTSNRIKQSARLRFNYIMDKIETSETGDQSQIDALDLRIRALEDRNGYTVTITVLNEIVGATVKIGSTTCTDNEDGTYTAENVTPDTYTLTVEKDGYDTYSSEIQVDYQHLSFEVELTEQTYTVSGTVTAYVAEEEQFIPAENAVVNILQDSTVIGTSTTDNSGAYSIEGIRDGTYDINAILDGYQEQGDIITVDGDDVTSNIQLCPE